MITLEFAGTICTGKRSLVGALKAILKKERPDLLVKTIAQDLVILSEMIDPKKHFDRQLLLMSNVTSQLITAQDSGIPLTFIHRGFFDGCAFLNAFVKAGVIDQKDAHPSLVYWKKMGKKMMDLVVLVETPAEEALKRARRKFGDAFKLAEPDIVFSKDFFDILDECYQDLKEHPPASSITVNGSNPISNVQRNAETVFKAIVDMLPSVENGDSRNGAEKPEAFSINSV